MRFLYEGNQPYVVLYGDTSSMDAFYEDLAVFGIKPEWIMVDGEVENGAAWNGLPIRPFSAIKECADIPDLLIVPLGSWIGSTVKALDELDSRLPRCIMRDIELLLRLSLQSKVEGLPAVSGARSDRTMLSLQLGFVLGGLETWVTNLYHQMKREGKPVVLLEPRQNSPYEYVGADFFDVSPDEVVSMGPFDSFMPYVERMIELLAHDPPRIFVDNGSYRLMAALYIAKKQLGLPIKVVSVLHGDVGIVYTRVTLCESVIDKFVAVSDPVRDRLHELLPHRAEDMVVQIQLPPAHPESIVNRPISEKLRIAYAARLESSNKRSMWLIDVMDGLKARGARFALFIAGEGACFEPLKAHIDENNMGEYVHMCGKLPREDMDAFWSDKHAFINFSISEGGPLTLFESMSHGLVPVVTSAGSAARLVFKEKSGYIIDSPQDAIDALCELAENSTRCAELQRGAMRAFESLQKSMGDSTAAFS